MDMKEELKETGDALQELESRAVEEEAHQDGESSGEQKITLTQAELDRIIQSRIRRAEKNLQERLEAERRKQEMSEIERLKAELEEYRNTASEAQRRAAYADAHSRAAKAALIYGVRPERLNYALKLIDLDTLETGESGVVEDSVIEREVKRLLRELPELAGKPAGTGGADFSQGAPPADPASMTMDEYVKWRKMNA